MNFFKELRNHMQNEKYDLALSVVSDAINFYKDNEILRKSFITEQNNIIKNIEFLSQLKVTHNDIRALYETEKTPYTYPKDTLGVKREVLPAIVSLTAISIRLEKLSQTIESIKNQTLLAHSINLYLSEDAFLIDQGVKKDDLLLKNLHTKFGVNIYLVPNIGPYRKQVPLLLQLQQAKAEKHTPFVTIDDDIIYPNNILEQLHFAHLKLGGIIAHRGRMMSFKNDGMIDSYTKFPIPKNEKALLNIGTGKNGIYYLFGFFPKKNLNLGAVLGPTTDDLWCKWVTALKCIPTYILEPEAAYKKELDFAETSTEKVGLFHNYNAKGVNDFAINNLEHYFKIQFGANIQSIYGIKTK
ncbi:MAG: hypothetical protein Q4G13_01685 [Moraxella sp.]|nr:hypothetical protein [Moraxella sp.]